MNNKKIFRTLLFSLVFLYVLCCSYIDVYAADENLCQCESGDILLYDTDGKCYCEDIKNTKCKNLFDSNGNVILTSVSDKYNPKLESAGAGTKKWKVSINPADSNDSTVLRRLKDVTFRLYSINGTLVTSDNYVKYNQPLTVTEQLDSNGYMTLRFKVVKEHLDPECSSEKLEFEVELYSGGDPVSYSETLPNIDAVEVPSADLNDINCNSPRDVFETNFCKGKNNASLDYTNRFSSVNSSSVIKYKDVFGTNNPARFTCDSTNVYTQAEILAGEDGYYTPTNVGYMYGSGTYSIDNGRYQYHFDPFSPTSGAKVTCKVTCEESVTVQYGAPVASKAGLCFEYKVKVTSRVVCNMTEAPPLPDNPSTVCTPTPTCTGIGRSGTRYYFDQGGPNEDFDACVKKCDGGKYTSSCSKQCYKQVYQKSLITYKSTKNDSLTLQSYPDCSGGCYYNGGTSWSAPYVPGRYYGGSCNSEYVPDSEGICRHDYGGGRICQDDCWWNGCPSGQYLNPGFSSVDYNNNMVKYNETVNKCKAAASCSTSQAEFTISVDYKDGSNTVKTVEFPYSTGGGLKDRACSNGSSGCSKTGTSATTTLLREQGCYDSSSSTKNLYLVEWGFPGSWINRKTGELSYTKPGNNAQGWQEVPRKFCLPFDTQDVNVDWWNYYYTQTGQNPACPQTSVPSVDYNIRANTTDFGYFGWDISISCFYAVNNTEKKPCDPGTPEDVQYIVRSVDLENLFPATDGSELSSSNDIGRTPGFNWSASAENTKNTAYSSSPLDYAKRIQDKGYTIYSSDSQLDYKFRLTPAVLKELKNARSTDYTYYNGSNFTDSNGVIRYKSNLELLSDSEITLKRPSESALKCNNIINGNSCESH